MQWDAGRFDLHAAQVAAPGCRASVQLWQVVAAGCTAVNLPIGHIEQYDDPAELENVPDGQG